MKKRLLAVLLVGAMALSVLTACGGSEIEEVPPKTEVSEEVKPEESKAEVSEEAVDSGMVSDETFAGLQESYTAMVDAYNAVVELYSSDEIAANPDMEEVFGEVKSVMDEMGEITQDQVTEEDAEVLLDTIITLLESLEVLVDNMEVVEEGEFTLLDVTSDMIDAAIYVGDESSEMVLSLFTAPDGTQMCSMLEYSASANSGDVACGAYTAETATDEQGIAWTYLTFEDVYTGTTMEMGFGETDAGECWLLMPSGDNYEAQYLSEEEAIAYMGTAVALLSE